MWRFILFAFALPLFAEENFLLVNGLTGEPLITLGSNIDTRITPCSTFKIALSVMGYDAGILKDEKTPAKEFQDGYDTYLESWKATQTPESWMQLSCIWYSKILAKELGLGRFQNYLSLLNYGNQDVSGGLTEAWVASSLKISPREQVDFLQKLVLGTLPVTPNAIQMTKTILFKESLPHGWKLFGKTGFGPIFAADGSRTEIGWFIGWIENKDAFFLFAYNILDSKITLNQRIPRVKQLLQVIVPGEQF